MADSSRFNSSLKVKYKHATQHGTPVPFGNCNAAALNCASPLSLVQLTMDRSIALSLIEASLLRQPTVTRSAIDQSTSSPSPDLSVSKKLD
jgi:hypothetical protein